MGYASSYGYLTKSPSRVPLVVAIIQPLCRPQESYGHALFAGKALELLRAVLVAVSSTAEVSGG